MPIPACKRRLRVPLCQPASRWKETPSTANTPIASRSGPAAACDSSRAATRTATASAAAPLSQTVSGITAKEGRWFRFRIRGMAQDGFHVQRDALFLKVEFFRDGGTNALDHLQKSIYGQIAQERDDLRDQSDQPQPRPGKLAQLRPRLPHPFPRGRYAPFERRLRSRGRARREIRIPHRRIRVDPHSRSGRVRGPHAKPKPDKSRPASDNEATNRLVPLGGRWYYDPRGGETAPPKEFDHTNADRLFYRTDRFEAPFADNMSAWLRKGDLDRSGHLVKKDRFIADNVRLTFTETDLVVHSHNLPNHPTAVFPDRWRALDGNPNYIREQNYTWFIPLEPRENPDHVAIQPGNANRALPGGPIGIAVNGVVFFNPFDADSVEAIWRLDRCCGHPSPGFEYHYHKYPVCVKSPWTDDGTAHSPLIGFAFDGFPIFGPYEAAGELAKDSQKNPLNAFNIHYDDQRGWHYHVTPGKFPHLIGGYWGVADARNRHRPPRGGRRKADPAVVRFPAVLKTSEAESNPTSESAALLDSTTKRNRLSMPAPTSNPVEILLEHDHWATRNVLAACAPRRRSSFTSGSRWAPDRCTTRRPIFSRRSEGGAICSPAARRARGWMGRNARRPN